MLPTVTMALLHRDLLGLARTRWLRCKRVALVSLFTVGLLLALLTAVNNGEIAGLGGTCFRPLAWLLLVAVAVLGPLAGLRAMAHEWRERTIGLLLLAPDGALPVVLGKVLGPLASSSLTLLAALPAMFFCLSMGGLSVGQMLGSLLLLEVTLLLGLCLGLWLASAPIKDDREGLHLLLILALQWGAPALLVVSLTWLGHSFYGWDLVRVAEYLGRLLPPVCFYQLLRGTAAFSEWAIVIAGSLLVSGTLLLLIRERLDYFVTRDGGAAPPRRPSRTRSARPAPAKAKPSAQGQAAPSPKARPRQPIFGRGPILIGNAPVADFEYWRHAWLSQRLLIYGLPLAIATLIIGLHGMIRPGDFPKVFYEYLRDIPLQALIYGTIILLVSWISLASKAFTHDAHSGALELLLLSHLPDDAIWRQKQLGHWRVLRRLTILLGWLLLANLLNLTLRGRPAGLRQEDWLLPPAFLALLLSYAWALGIVGLRASLLTGKRRRLAWDDVLAAVAVLLGSWGSLALADTLVRPAGARHASLGMVLLAVPPAVLGWVYQWRLRREFRHLALAASKTA